MTLNDFRVEPEQLSNAYYAGRRTARALQPGDLFSGAMPAGEAAGYPKETALNRIFIRGYLEVIEARWPKGVPVTSANIILAE